MAGKTKISIQVVETTSEQRASEAVDQAVELASRGFTGTIETPFTKVTITSDWEM